MSTVDLNFDVVIVGGGPVGATLGALLRHAPAGRVPRVLLLERALPPERARSPVDAAFTPDLRVFALSRASERILRAIGGWEALSADSGSLAAYERMHVWPMRGQPRGDGALTFDAAELGEPNLGHIVGNTALQRAALAAFEAAGGCVQQGSVQGVEFLADRVRLQCSTGVVTAALLVGADGVVVESPDLPTLKKTEKHDVDVVVDRVKLGPDAATSLRQRLAESFETALRLSDGRALVLDMVSGA